MDPAASSPSQKLSTYTPQDDSSKYIRTYAKDVAALTNSAPVQSKTQSVSKKESEKDIASSVGVSLPEFDASPVNHQSDPSSPKEFKQEVVDLVDSDSDGIFKGKDIPAPRPLMPQQSLRVQPTIPSSGAPITPPRPAPPAEDSSPTPTTSTVDADREAVLARLRAKIASDQAPKVVSAPKVIEPIPPAPKPLPEPVTVPTPIPEERIRAAAPDFSTTPEPTLPIPQVQPKVAPLETTQKGPAALHTYSTDFADHIDSQKSSTFSVLAAQSDAGQTPRPQSSRSRSIVPLLAGIFMFVIGIGAVTTAYIYNRQQTTVPAVANIPSLITFDESVEVMGTGSILMKNIATASQGESLQGNIVVTYVTETGATSTGSGIPQPGGVLIKKLSLSAPDILLRNIAETSTVGFIHAGEESRPFLLLRVTSYERTFAGMLAWERTIRDDLTDFYPDYASAPVQSFGTSSPATSFTNQRVGVFTDAVVANYDVRILRDSSGRSILLYGYRGKDTLLIARDEAAFTALVERLRASGK